MDLIALLQNPAFLGFVGGIASGVLTSIFAPWIQWQREQERARIEERRARIRRWREFVGTFDFEHEKIGATVEYSEMHELLTLRLQEAIDRGRMAFVFGDGRGPFWAKAALLDEIARIERDWKLI